MKSRTGRSQKTLARRGAVSGIGLHSGQPCTVIVGPAPTGAGIRFYKGGRRLDGKLTSQVSRRTTLGSAKQRVETVEHLLAAFSGLGIDNADADVHGPEIPALDGSAVGFVRLFKKLGLKTQGAPKRVYRLTEPIFCYDKDKAILAIPSEGFKVGYVLDYGHPRLNGQIVDFEVTADVFAKQIAPARTFCSQEEALQLRRMGFGLGADHKNTLVIGPHGPVRNKLRFSDECARHKVLDLIGDLKLLGFSIEARIVGLRSGHQLNRRLVEAIKKQRGL